MAGLVEHVVGVEQAVGIDNQAARFDGNVRKERVWVQRRQADGKSNLPKTICNERCRRVEHPD
jgi:hypothetical protein